MKKKKKNKKKKKKTGVVGHVRSAKAYFSLRHAQSIYNRCMYAPMLCAYILRTHNLSV